MLKNLITMLTGNLFSKKNNPGYQTRIYPRLGEAVTIHDTLDFGPIATFQEFEHLNDFWLSDEIGEIIPQKDSWPEHEFDFGSIHSFNPANGLPMMDDCIDIAGNMYGMSDSSTDIFSD